MKTKLLLDLEQRNVTGYSIATIASTESIDQGFYFHDVSYTKLDD